MKEETSEWNESSDIKHHIRIGANIESSLHEWETVRLR